MRRKSSSAPEALAALDRSSFDLILLDVQMPVMDGLDAAGKSCVGSPIPSAGRESWPLPQCVGRRSGDVPGRRHGRLSGQTDLATSLQGLRRSPVLDDAAGARAGGLRPPGRAR